MKSKKIICLEKILRFMAKAVIWKYKPKIVGITGSVGKSSAKEAIFLVLSPKFSVRKNEKNYNNEIGIPLTIIGSESGNGSIWRWAKIFLKWLSIIIFPVNYPEILVLEMGVDRPGDMDYLLSFVCPTVGVITDISGSHLEFFKGLGHIAKEKGKLVRNLPKDGLAILNFDNENVLNIKEKLESGMVFFGMKEGAEIKASYIGMNSDNFKPQGISFKLNYQGKVIPIRLPYVLAPHLIYAVLSAIAVGIFFKINIIEIAKTLESFRPLPGRMNLIYGRNKSFIIDDSYNSSPASALAAIEVLKNIRAVRKIVALGDMLELGDNSESGHRDVLKKAFESNAALFFVSGSRMEKFLKELEAQGKILGKMFYFENPEQLGKELGRVLREGDLVLVKGSQGARMEMAVKEMMGNSEEAGKLLCRQSREWLRKPYLKP